MENLKMVVCKNTIIELDIKVLNKVYCGNCQYHWLDFKTRCTIFGNLLWDQDYKAWKRHKDCLAKEKK